MATTVKKYTADSPVAKRALENPSSYAGNQIVIGGKTYEKDVSNKFVQSPAKITPVKTTPVSTGVTPTKPITTDSGLTKISLTSPAQVQEQGVGEPITDFTQQLKQMSEGYQAAFKNLQSILGEQTDSFQKELQKIQKQTGMKVDIEQPGFAETIQKLKSEGAEGYTPVLERYVKGMTPQDIEQRKQQAIRSGLAPDMAQSAMDAYNSGVLFPEQAKKYFEDIIKKNLGGEVVSEVSKEKPKEEQIIKPQKNPASGYSKDIVPESSPTEKMKAGLDNIVKMDGSSLTSTLEGLGLDMKNMSSSELLQVMLLQQGLAIASDPSTSNYLLKATDNAKKSFDLANSLYGEGGKVVKEIDAAIEGQDFIPTTYEGLSAKVYQQAKDLQMESVKVEKDWYTAQYNAWLSEETDKRNRLEGYLKAKLYAAGAQDSSAGLQTMALQVNAADMRLQLKQSEYNYGISKLNLESRNIMNNYTNNVVKLNMDAQDKKTVANEKYDEKLLQIEGLLIQDNKEKNKLRFDAFAQFNTAMYKIDQDKKTREWDEYKQHYKELQDTIDNAFKLNGETGTVHYVDKDGEIVDSGVKTFAYDQWEQTNYLDWAKYNHNVESNTWAKAKDMLEGGVNPAFVEQLTGMKVGSLSGYKSTLERQEALEKYKNNLENSFVDMPYISDVGDVIATMYSDDDWGGQCGEFIHNFVTDYPTGLNTLDQKMTTINSNTPSVGSVVILDESYPGTNTGHVAMVNAIANGKLRLTESNYVGKEIVSNDREIDINYPKIKGYFNGTLKPGIKDSIAKMNTIDGSVLNKYNQAFNNVLVKVGPVKSKELKQNYNYYMKSGDMEAAKNYLKQIGMEYNLTGKQKDDYDDFTLVAQGMERIAKQTDPNSPSGIYTKLFNDARKWINLEQDEKYRDLFADVFQVQAAYKRALYGTAVTSTEFADGQKFLIRDDDKVKDIIFKAKNMASYAKQVTQNIESRALGGIVLDSPVEGQTKNIYNKIIDRAKKLKAEKAKYDWNMVEVPNSPEDILLQF